MTRASATRWSLAILIACIAAWCAAAAVVVVRHLENEPTRDPVRKIEMMVENSLQRAQDSIDLVSYFDSLRRMDSAALAESFARKAALLRKRLPTRVDSFFRTDSFTIPCDAGDVRTFMATDSAHVIREDSIARELEVCRFSVDDAQAQLEACQKEKAPSCFWPAAKACVVCGFLGLAGGVVTGDAVCQEISRP